MTSPAGEVVLYADAEGQTRLQVRLDDGSLWLSQAQLADLYGTSIANINQHISAVYTDGEQQPEATFKDFLIVRSEGERQVQRRTKSAADDDYFEEPLARIRDIRSSVKSAWNGRVGAPAGSARLRACGDAWRAGLRAGGSGRRGRGAGPDPRGRSRRRMTHRPVHTPARRHQIPKSLQHVGPHRVQPVMARICCAWSLPVVAWVC